MDHPASTSAIRYKDYNVFKRLLVTRVLPATVLYSHALSSETPSPFSQIRSGAKDGLDLVSSQFRESHDLEDSLFPILVPDCPKRERFYPVPLGSLQGQQSPSFNQPPPRPLNQPSDPSPAAQRRSRSLQPQLALSRDSPTLLRANSPRASLENHLLQNGIRDPRGDLPIKIRKHPGR